MTAKTIALSGAALLAMTLTGFAQESGGAASGGATSSAPTAAPEQPAPQQTYTPPPPPPPAPTPILGGWYFGIGGGWDEQNGIKFNNFTTGDSGTVNTNDNALVIGSIGYRLPTLPLRLEVEGGYTWHDVHTIDNAVGNFPASGHANLGHVLVNAVYDIPLGERWALSLGGGVGAAFTNYSIDTGSISGSASNTNLMWQGIGGISYRLSPNMDLFADYRYRAANTSKDVTLNNGDLAKIHDTTENAVLVGLRWYMWSPGG